jgi:uracil-DNA glycosylase
VRAVLVLGRIAFEAYRRVVGEREDFPRRSTLVFSHGASLALPAGLPRLFCSYHPSQQNTQTGRLTPEMFQQVLRDIREFLGPTT